MKKVAIVILNYRVNKETIECVGSVKKSDYGDVETIVVDNSPMSGLDKLIEKYPEVVFIQNKVNLGYCGGNNVGIKEALKMGADYIFILNPDTLVGSSTIGCLVSAAERHEAGIVAPKILFADKKTIWYAGGIFDFANVLGGHRGVDETDRGQYAKEEETDYASGGAMMVSREVFKKIGFFDERYFLYYEDSDFSLRSKSAGFKVVFVPEAVIYHHNAKSTGLGSPLQDYFITRNRMLFAAKFLNLRTRFALLREAVGNINIRARRLALYDFLIGNFGKGSFLK